MSFCEHLPALTYCRCANREAVEARDARIKAAWEAYSIEFSEAWKEFLEKDTRCDKENKE